MARPLRIEFAGGVYHVRARGNAKQAIYLDDRDREFFLDVLWDVCERLDWQIWAYCLMPNHYHLLLRTAHANLSRGMRDLNGRYSSKFNFRHDRVGHVFQGRFKSTVVDTDAYLLELSRYVVLNPVKAGLCGAPERWSWSSFRAMLGLSKPGPQLAVDATLLAFGSNRKQARAKFAEFVSAGVVAPMIEHRVPSIVGDEGFISNVAARVVQPSPEVPKADRAFKRLEDYAREATTRNQAMRAAYGSGSYTQAQIARHFGLHYGSVSRILRNRSCRDVEIQDLTP